MKDHSSFRAQHFSLLLSICLPAIISLSTLANAQTETLIAYTNINYAGVTFDSAGNLYGVTYNGGSSTNCGDFENCGSVFELSPAGGGIWTLTTIYDFQNLADGSFPLGGLTIDSAGNLYGTTTKGGRRNAGVAFELSPSSGNSWTLTPLHSFGQTSLSVAPSTPLTLDAAGNLYGMTTGGGSYSSGSAFKLSKEGGRWKEQILHSFGGPGDGAQPFGPPVIDVEANVYGMASAGGPNGRGTVFQLSPQSSGGWKENLLYTFPSNGGFSQAGLIFDSAHNLYGTTSLGGSDGYGGVFRLTPVKKNGNLRWKYSQLYSFTAGADGSNPASPLTFDASGNLYGTDNAPQSECSDPFFGCGQVYKLSVGANGLWQNSALYFIPASGQPSGSVILDSSGDIFGTAYDNHYFTGAAVYQVTQ